MLARYLGSKREILPEILSVVTQVCEPGSHIVDAFSGSLAVSLGLKKYGYRVSSNDVNLFSSVLAEAYLIPTRLPAIDIDKLVPDRKQVEKYSREAENVCALLDGSPGFSFLKRPGPRASYLDVVALITHLSSLEATDLPPEYRNSYIFDSYCEAGKNSAYVSSRGRAGSRRFFSPENARRIDLIVNQLRAWQLQGNLPRQTMALLLSVLMRATEKVANTQGTFHDFPRTTWDSRALKPITLSPPPLDDLYAGTGGHQAGKEQDSLEWISQVDKHDLLYLDPPYNFRQYTAYYFLPNVLCRYPFMTDLSEYFSGIKYVRGQNPSDDFVSSFCKARLFIGEMQTLIRRANTEYVVVSYFNGKNHWGSFDSDPTDTGRELLTELLQGEDFVPGSLQVVEIPRTNYASYGGFKARAVSELLLVARKRQDLARAPEDCAERGISALA